MSYPDLGSGAQTVITIPPAVYSSAETGTTVDTKGFRMAYVVATIGVLGADSVIKIQHSLTNDSDWVDLTGATMTAVNGTDEDSVFVAQVDTQSTSRYIRAHATASSGEAVSVAIVLHFSKDTANYVPTTLKFSV